MTIQQNCSRDTIMSLGKEYLKRRLQIDYSSFDHWITLCQQVAVVEKVLINTKYSYACNCIVGSKGKLCVHIKLCHQEHHCKDTVSNSHILVP